ncbi:MAG TPA: Gfo/Idh/MocA family oxidoreductase [Planctomycetota bacterium]|jgi:predicted dehydrogenase
MGKEIRFGIVGVGQIGKQHLANWAKIPDAKLVAACDIDVPELNRVCAEHKIPNKFTDFKELLKMDEIDAVDVCLHNNLHAPVTMAVLKAGKHAYCEKPIAGTFRDGLNMVTTAQKCKKMLHIQLSTLYSMEHKVAQRLIEGGHLGQLYHARAYGFRRRGRPFVDGYGTDKFCKKDVAAGGALFDMGVYHIGEVLHLLGNPKILSVSGATHQQLPMYEDRRKSSGFSVEEFGVGFVRLAGGITLDIEESWAQHYDGSESSKIFGSKGGLKLSPFTFFSNSGDVELSSTVDLKALDFRWHACEKDFAAYDSSQEHWLAALQGRVDLLDTAGITLNTMLISEGIYQSQKEGRELTAAEILENSKSTALKL